MQNFGGPNPDPLLEAKYGGRTARDYDLSLGAGIVALVLFLIVVAVAVRLVL